MFYPVKFTFIELSNFNIFRYFRIPILGQIGHFMPMCVIMLSAKYGIGRIEVRSLDSWAERWLRRPGGKWQKSVRCEYLVSCQTAPYCGGSCMWDRV